MGAPPLTPAAGGMCIPPIALQVADIIVSTTAEIGSAVIRLGTGSAISHSGVYVGGGQIVEALTQGVVKQSVDDAMRDDTLVVAYRHPRMTIPTALKISNFVSSKVGRPYDSFGTSWKGAVSPAGQAAIGVAGLAAGGLIGAAFVLVTINVIDKAVQPGDGQDKFYCSELIFRAYADAGLPLGQITSAPSKFVALANNGTLRYAGHLKT